jgi:hypothetical protein
MSVALASIVLCDQMLVTQKFRRPFKTETSRSSPRRSVPCDLNSATHANNEKLINSDRRGQAQSISNNVRQRHEAIQKIEQDMIQLAQLFNDLEVQVLQQEPAVARIEEQGEQVNTEVAKAVC